MEEFTNVFIRLPKDFDYQLNLYMAEMKRRNIKITKAEAIVKFARIGLLNEKI